jgi:hypothetical protein
LTQTLAFFILSRVFVNEGIHLVLSERSIG